MTTAKRRRDSIIASHLPFPRAIGIAAIAFALSLIPRSAAAATSSDLHTARIMLLAVVVGAAYLVLKVLLDRVRSRILAVSGLEHAILGLMLGPVVFSVGVFGETTPLLPFAAIAAGWVALSCGTDFNLRALSDPPRGGPRLGFLSAAICGTSVAASAWGAFSSGWLGRFAPDDVLSISAWMGCAAAAASNRPLEVIQDRYQTADTTGSLLRRSARFANLLALVSFGVIACIFQPGYSLDDHTLSAVELAVIALGLGAVLGVAFAPYLGRADTLAGRVLLLAAMVAFASGAAYWFGLSPLWVTLTLGAVLVNTSLHTERIVDAVRAASSSVAIVLFLLAGALWTPPPLVPALVATAGVITLRFVGCLLSSWIVAKWLAPMRVDTGRGLLAQGEVAIAIAIAFRLGTEGPLADIGYTAILGSVLAYDILAPRALRGLLLDAGELRRAAEAKG